MVRDPLVIDRAVVGDDHDDVGRRQLTLGEGDRVPFVTVIPDRRDMGIVIGHEGAIQLALPFDRQASAALDAALDQVRDRFGSAAITRAVLLGRDQGFSMPMLPD